MRTIKLDTQQKSAVNRMTAIASAAIASGKGYSSNVITDRVDAYNAILALANAGFISFTRKRMDDLNFVE